VIPHQIGTVGEHLHMIKSDAFKSALQNKQVKLKDLKNVPADIMKALKKADTSGTGVISGKNAVQVFRALDKLDNDGKAGSLGDGRAAAVAKQMMQSAAPALPASAPGAATPASGSDATVSGKTNSASGGMKAGAMSSPRGITAPSSSTAPSASPLASGATDIASSATGGNFNGTARVRNDGSLSNYKGGVGNIAVAQENGRTSAFQFKADMDVDTDGGSSAASKSDKYYQSGTSMKLGGRSLDADKIPFVVLPPGLAKQTGAKLGDLVLVEQNGKKMYGIYADNGPNAKIGEASSYMAKFFDPTASGNKSANGTFSYTVLPGSGAAAGIKNGGAAITAQEIQTRGEAAFSAAKSRGIV
jgi:hypothetical protein